MNNSEPSDQALVISKEQTRNVRQGSASPDWVMYPEAEAYQKDQVESSSQQSSNAELFNMLKRIEQGLLKSDIQLRAHMEKRDQYFEEEIRKTYQFIDEAIKKRDLEWKEEPERKDQPWRTELKQRDQAYWQG